MQIVGIQRRITTYHIKIHEHQQISFAKAQPPTKSSHTHIFHIRRFSAFKQKTHKHTLAARCQRLRVPKPTGKISGNHTTRDRRQRRKSYMGDADSYIHIYVQLSNKENLLSFYAFMCFGFHVNPSHWHCWCWMRWVALMILLKDLVFAIVFTVRHNTLLLL